MCKVPVTIGLCVKNCSETISETLKCIISQDYSSEMIEIIVVDDNSSDNTLSRITETLANSPFKFRVFSTKGKGLGVARQLVVNSANGKYILWIDGDMIVPENYVKLQVEFMEKNPQVGKARAKWGILDEDSLPAKLESMRLIEHLSNKKTSSSYLVGIGGSICRTKALREIGGFDENIKGAGEDIDLAVRLAKSWKFAISNAVFYHHFRKTWRGLWQQYFWYGYGMHYVNHKHKGISKVWTYLPPVSLSAGLRQAFIAFKQTKEKIAFLLPLQYFFKYSAWILGYVESHLNGYDIQKYQNNLNILKKNRVS